jgi:hypothetical protein
MNNEQCVNNFWILNLCLLLYKSWKPSKLLSIMLECLILQHFKHLFHFSLIFQLSIRAIKRHRLTRIDVTWSHLRRFASICVTPENFRKCLFKFEERTLLQETWIKILPLKIIQIIFNFVKRFVKKLNFVHPVGENDCKLIQLMHLFNSTLVSLSI